MWIPGIVPGVAVGMIVRGRSVPVQVDLRLVEEMVNPMRLRCNGKQKKAARNNNSR